MVMKHTIEERKELARALRREGQTCSQCVVGAFDDVAPAEVVKAVERAAEGFGSGFGAKGMTCGAVSGMTMVLSLVGARSRPKLYAGVRMMVDEFGALEGDTECAALKKPGRKPCIDLITDAVEMVHNYLESRDEEA